MQKRQTMLAILGLIICILGIPPLLKLPAFWSGFDYSNSDSIATAISGFTAPIISLVSIILIYLAFNKQSEANLFLREQNESLKEQKEVEFIFSLFDHLDKDLAKIYFWEPMNGERVYSYGYEALLRITKVFGWAYVNHTFAFTSVTKGRMIISIANSFQNLIESIEESQISEQHRKIFQSKIEYYYYSWLSLPFERVIREIDRNRTDPNKELFTLLNLAYRFDNLLASKISNMSMNHNSLEVKEAKDMDKILKYVLKFRNPFSIDQIQSSILPEENVNYCIKLYSQIKDHDPEIISIKNISHRRTCFILNEYGKMFLNDGGFTKEYNNAKED